MKNKKIIVLILLVLSMIFVFGCSKSDEVLEIETDSFDYEIMKKEENIVGKSDKNFKKDITESEPIYVSETIIPGIGDAEGRVFTWKAITISKPINMEEYALSYKKENMKKDELHFIINTANSTNTMIDVYDGIIYMSVKEYTYVGDYDSKILSGGIPLYSFCIYPDGDIQKIEAD